MTKQTVQTVEFTHTIDTADFMASLPEFVQKALNRSTAAFAGIMPELLAEIEGKAVGANVVELDKGAVAITNATGTRFKVVVSEGTRFNVAPSYCKGYGRSDDGISARQYLSDKFDYVVLVNVKNRNELKACKIRVREIEGNTIVAK